MKCAMEHAELVGLMITFVSFLKLLQRGLFQAVHRIAEQILACGSCEHPPVVVFR